MDSGGTMKGQWYLGFTKEGGLGPGMESQLGERASGLRKGTEDPMEEEKNKESNVFLFLLRPCYA